MIHPKIKWGNEVAFLEKRKWEVVEDPPNGARDSGQYYGQQMEAKVGAPQPPTSQQMEAKVGAPLPPTPQRIPGLMEVKIKDPLPPTPQRIPGLMEVKIKDPQPPTSQQREAKVGAPLPPKP